MKKHPICKNYNVNVDPHRDTIDGRAWRAPAHPEISFFRVAKLLNAADREYVESKDLEKSAICGELLTLARDSLNGAQLRNFLAEFTRLDADKIDAHLKNYRHSLVNAAIKTSKEEFYNMLLTYAACQNYKRGWAYYAYKERFNEEPPKLEDRKHIEPNSEVLRFIRLREIRRKEEKTH